MGSAVSKAPKRTFPKTRTLQQTEDATRQTADQVSPSIGVQPDTQQQLGASAQQFVVQTNAYPHLQGSNPNVCADQKEQEENQDHDFLRQLKQDGVRHAELGSFLDKLGGAIAGKHVTTLDMKVLQSTLAVCHEQHSGLQYPVPAHLWRHLLYKNERTLGQNSLSDFERAPCPAAWCCQTDCSSAQGRGRQTKHSSPAAPVSRCASHRAVPRATRLGFPVSPVRYELLAHPHSIACVCKS